MCRKYVEMIRQLNHCREIAFSDFFHVTPVKKKFKKYKKKTEDKGYFLLRSHEKKPFLYWSLCSTSIPLKTGNLKKFDQKKSI